VLLGALVRYVLEEQKDFREYVLHYTNASVILRDDMRDTEDLDGLFSGWDPGGAALRHHVLGYAAGTEGATGYQQT
jgi:formate dehydrogenase major subunit